MKVKIYSNPKEAYEFMNSWTQIKSSYETQFHGKNVNEVKIIMQRGVPRLSFVHYKTDFGEGIQTIDL
ncbi:MAG: hypothetical protein KKB62_01250 [Nanoarchaeota archaeon]|nr:hypothetical protein [Nanoarchaeota archaeon]